MGEPAVGYLGEGPTCGFGHAIVRSGSLHGRLTRCRGFAFTDRHTDTITLGGGMVILRFG